MPTTSVNEVERYWLFAGFCLAIGLLLVRMIARERITLQGSLSYLGLLCAMLLVAMFPEVNGWLARRMGFVVASNFLFSMAIGALALLHLAALITISKLELRSITLTQELALLQEKLERQSPTPPRQD